MPSCCPRLLRSLMHAATRAFGVQALAEFQPDRHTSTPPGTWRSPSYLGVHPSPGQCWNPGAHGTGRMAWGMGEGLGALPCVGGLPLGLGVLLCTHPVLVHSGGLLADGCSAFF